MTDFEAPRLAAPRLDAILGRRAPNLPMHTLRRVELEGPPSPDPGEAAFAALEPHLSRIRPGDVVAIGVGSRGIKVIGPVVAGMVRAVRERGGSPFILPAMGSHGGASAEGQRQTLAGLGVTENLVGAPVRATMDTVPLGMADDVDIAVDAYASKADHILLVNRLKSHTSFSGEIESGLAKMLAIGFGKQHGAEELHRRGPVHIERRIRTAAASISARLPVIGGLALVEGRDKRLVAVDFVPAEQIGGAREAQLLRLAKDHEARLPFDQIDVLVVDVMGKEFSGTGMDTNVIGRRMVRSMPELATPRITNIVCLDISPASHGNAVGIGLADFTTQTALLGFDPIATYANTLTAGSQGVQRAQIPIVLADESDAVSAAILTSDVSALEEVRLARVRNTLNLDDMMVSTALLDEATSSYERHSTTSLFTSGDRLSTW
jgi:hypothetical protein